MIETLDERHKREKAEMREREERTKAYAAKMNLPVPVLAGPEPSKNDDRLKTQAANGTSGEARESTNVKVPGPIGPDTSRGGQTPQEKWRKKNKAKLAEYQRMYRAQQRLKKGK